MTREEFEAIFDDCDTIRLEGCNALQGLKIIEKYLPGSGIEGAEHDVIYACGIDELIDAGITEEDALKLAQINWMADCEHDCMACFV